MKRKILLLLLLISVGAYSQEYAKYRNSKSNTQAAKPPKDTKKEKKEPVAPVKEAQVTEAITEPSPNKHKGDFQATMERAVVQSKAGKLKKAIEIYTEAFEIGTKDEIWRAVVSRASVYSQMQEYDKAVAEYTWMIEDSLTPQKKKAYAYYMRAVIASQTETKDDDERGCEDLKKAKETGFPIAGRLNLECN